MARLSLIVATAFVVITTFNIIWIETVAPIHNEYTTVSMWLWPLAVALIIGLPCAATGKTGFSFCLIFMLAAFLEANLMYMRNFGDRIPNSCYSLWYNLSDFTDAVAFSIEPCDTLFLLFPVMGLVAMKFTAKATVRSVRLTLLPYAGVAILITAASIVSMGDIDETILSLSKSHRHHSLITTRLSPFGAMIAESAGNNVTDADRREIERLKSRRITPFAGNRMTYDNLVVVFVESLESWTIGSEVNGHELTPNLNSVTRDSTTLFIPHTVDLTGAGRSIDAQLLVIAGLIPSRDCIWSFRYPRNHYPSLYKAVKSASPSTKVISFTGDKASTYNVDRCFPLLGIDSLYARDFFSRHSSATFRHVPDKMLVSKAIPKLDAVWKPGEKAVVQFTTYSCHTPFTMPRDGRGNKIITSHDVDKTVADYMNVVNYTDEALGMLIKYLKSRPDFGRTLVVITGDHHVLTDATRKEVPHPDARPEVPLIMLNVDPAATMAARHTITQADIYPTILGLMGIDTYFWAGTGTPAYLPPDTTDLTATAGASRAIVINDLLR